MLYDWKRGIKLAKGTFERVGIGNSFLRHKVYNKEEVKINIESKTHKHAIDFIIKTLTDKEYGVIDNLLKISAVGHRVVHGGERFTKSTLIDDKELKTFKELEELAPLHNPPNVRGIEAAQEFLPDIPHIAVMDTAFLQTMPKKNYIYALPYEWYEKYGIRKYGFHGTSHLYVSRRAAVLLRKKTSDVNLITCHIGNGVSITAIKNGVAYDHSMGFTPLEGLVMGTRCGDIDPAIIPYIMLRTGLFPDDIERILNKKSGLLGISGKYIDRRDIIKAMEQGDERAELAFDIEVQRIKKYIGAYCAVLGRVDAVVFTAGVGELSSKIREKVLEGLGHIGIVIDYEENDAAVSREIESEISSTNSKVKVFVIPTDEEMVIVEDTVAIVEERYDVHTKFEYSFQSPEYKKKKRKTAVQSA